MALATGSAMSSIRSFAAVMNVQTAVVIILAVVSTWVCLEMGWAAEVPAGLIGLAVVFPIVFSINAAYRRREEVLRYYGSLKAHAVALHLAHRDWIPAEDGSDEHASRAGKLVIELLEAVRAHFDRKSGRTETSFRAVYEVFSRFSSSHEMLRAAGLAPSEASRANQYLSKMGIEFERMENIMRYRTPLSLRAYSSIFLNGFPIVFGPYFAHLATEKPVFVGYVVAITYSLVLVTLDNIQEDLEDPFDRVGTDDVNLNQRGIYSSVIDACQDG